MINNHIDSITKELNQPSRNYSIDALRIFGITIVILHSGVGLLLPEVVYNPVQNTTAINIMFFLESLFSAPLVLFIMISSALLLDPSREITTGKVWKSYIPKLAISYIVWGYIYGFVRLLMQAPEEQITLKNLTIQALNQPTHMIYLMVFLGVYIFIPIFREITKSLDKKVLKYILVIFIIALGLQTIISIDYLPYYQTYIKNIISKTPIHYICQYMMWFLVGFAVYKYKFSKRTRITIYILGILSVLLVFMINLWQYYGHDIGWGNVLTGDFTITTFFKYTAIFLFFNYEFKADTLSERNKFIIYKISATVPIVYLIHWLFFEVLSYKNLFKDTMSTVTLVFIYSLITIIGCILIALLFRSLPLKKWYCTALNNVKKIFFTKYKNTEKTTHTLNNITEPVHFGQGERDYSVDILRICSCFMVILVHCTAFFLPFRYDVTSEGSIMFYVMFFYRALFAAPTVLFVMVSGIFFLTPTRKVSAKKIWTKNIPKLASAYVFWCYIYGFLHIKMYSPETSITFKVLTEKALDEPTPFWYIPMIIGVYAFAPIFRELTKSSNIKVFRYILVVFVIAVCIDTINWIPHFPYYGTYIKSIMAKVPVTYFCQYFMWFILGYILYSYRLSDKVRRWFYALGIIGVLTSFLVNVWQYIDYGEAKGNILQTKFTFTTFFKNTAIFLLFTTNLRKIELSDRARKIISKISGTTLIVYLMHWILLETMFNAEWLQSYISPALLVFIYAITTFIIGCLVSIAFQTVPWRKIKRAALSKIVPNSQTKDNKKPASRSK